MLAALGRLAGIWVIFVLASCAIPESLQYREGFDRVNLSFSDNSRGICTLENDLQSVTVPMPGLSFVRNSDAPLKFDCTTQDGRKSTGEIHGSVKTEVPLSVMFLTVTDPPSEDKKRYYPNKYVILVPLKS